MVNLENFIKAYQDQYGEETKPLLEACLKEPKKLAMLNPFIEEKELLKLKNHESSEVLGFKLYDLPMKPFLIKGLLSHYFLDPSSLYAPLSLPLKPGMKVLDMCSAPGGKLLAMIFRQIPKLTIVANDLSSSRSLRLRQVIESYVPKSAQSGLSFAQKDANLIGLKQALEYDAILLDAPCSGEGHVLRNPHLRQAFKKLSVSLPKRQYSLLCSALLAAKKQAYIAYSTCSINTQENQMVVEKFINKKTSEKLTISKLSGASFLPNKNPIGPAFYQLLKIEKINSYK